MSIELSAQVIERFWENVEKTSYCWNWIGTIRRDDAHYGIPHMMVNHKNYSPRIVSLLISGATNPKLSQPLVCKNVSCVNPDHLASDDQSRFWAKVQKLSDDCWIWTGTIAKGYGVFYTQDGRVAATHYSWLLFSGRRVPDGIFACHSCDTPLCVNPHHLFLGTTQDNTQDMVEKDRQARGERQGNAKLTVSLVQEIRALCAQGFTYKELGDRFHVNPTAIAKIDKRVTWKHVT